MISRACSKAPGIVVGGIWKGGLPLFSALGGSEGGVGLASTAFGYPRAGITHSGACPDFKLSSTITYRYERSTILYHLFR